MQHRLLVHNPTKEIDLRQVYCCLFLSYADEIATNHSLYIYSATSGSLLLF